MNWYCLGMQRCASFYKAIRGRYLDQSTDGDASKNICKKVVDGFYFLCVTTDDDELDKNKLNID